MIPSRAAPSSKVPTRWGFCFAGNELAFCGALEVAARQPLRAKDEPFFYFEIGIGNGDCLCATAQYLRHLEVPYCIVGVDLPNYKGGAERIPQVAPEEIPHMRENSVCTSLTGAAEFFARCQQRADFIFIDACHGAPCVANDFLGAEKLIRPGGVICFHDTDPLCQGQHKQPHCGTGIMARSAVAALGLLDGSRPGWQVIDETSGDKAKGGHGCLFVQRLP